MILLLIWMYLSWLILLVGSQIAYFVQFPKYMALERVSLVLSNRLRERIALQIMYLVGYNHLHGKPPWNLDQLVDHLELPGEPVHRMILVLVDAGYLVEIINDNIPEYLPVHDVDTIRLVDLLAVIRTAQETRLLNLKLLAPVKAVDNLMAEINESSQAALGERTLRDLVLSTDEDPEAVVPIPVQQG
jgi:membrane protein